MSLNEIISSFKEFILTDPYEVSDEDQDLFRSELGQMPSEYLTQLRIVLEQLRVRLHPGVYKTYYAFINSLIGVRDGLKGRISPDILEPIAQVNYLNPIRSIETNESMEITTGTSIWALYLKRQLLDQNRVNQRQIKSAILLKFVLLRLTIALKIFAFFKVYYWKFKKSKLNRTVEILKNWIKEEIKTVFFRVIEYGKARKRMKKKIEKAFGCWERLRDKNRNGCMGNVFFEWKNKVSWGFSYFSISPIKGEKEVDYESECKLVEACGVLSEKNNQTARIALGRMKKITKKVIFRCFFTILTVSMEAQSGLECEKLSIFTKTEKLLEILKFSYKKSYQYLVKFCFNILKTYETQQKTRQKALNSITKYLKFRIFTFFSTFTKLIHKEYLKTSLLELHLKKLTTKTMRKHFTLLLSHPSFLLKKGFEAFIHNFYQQNIETINKSWRWKLSNNESKHQTLFSNSKALKSQTSFLFSVIESYTKSLKIHTFNTLTNKKF